MKTIKYKATNKMLAQFEAWKKFTSKKPFNFEWVFDVNQEVDAYDDYKEGSEYVLAQHHSFRLCAYFKFTEENNPDTYYVNFWISWPVSKILNSSQFNEFIRLYNLKENVQVFEISWSVFSNDGPTLNIEMKRIIEWFKLFNYIVSLGDINLVQMIVKCIDFAQEHKLSVLNTLSDFKMKNNYISYLKAKAKFTDANLTSEEWGMLIDN